MSLGNCIPSLVASGRLTKAQGDRAQEAYQRQYRRLSRDMSPSAAAAEASEAAINEIEFEARLKRYQTLKQVDAVRRAQQDMALYDGGKGGRRGQAELALLDQDGKAPYANVSVQKQAIVGRVHSMMESLLERFDRNLVGEMKDKATMSDVLRELFGEDSGNQSAKELAAAWSNASEYLRQRFNAAGGAIGKIENWGLPQGHDPVTIRNGGFEAWRDFTAPRLDRAKMIDEGTGAPMDDETLNEALRSAFDTITTDGWINREPLHKPPDAGAPADRVSHCSGARARD